MAMLVGSGMREGRTASVNGWPEGRRRVACLNCNRPFWSLGKAHRLCTACRGLSAVEHADLVTSGHASGHRQAA